VGEQKDRGEKKKETKGTLLLVGPGKAAFATEKTNLNGE